MRQILFRGKRTDNGEWETGSLVIIRDGCSDKEVFIADKMTGYNTPVIKETVGQFTGLTDKNGVRIFEGDILRDDDNEENGVVEFVDGEFCVVFGNIETHGIADIACCCYVIGNIHDNPELLKGGE